MVIFSVNQKKNAVIALMAVLLVYGAQTFAMDQAGNSQVTENNRGMLANVYSRIAGFVAQSKQRVDSFFDTRNRESYSAHIERMEKDLQRVEQEIMIPLQQALMQEASSDELYITIVRKTDSIIKELHANLTTLHSALAAHRNNKNAKNVIDALKAVQAKVAVRLVSLEKNINELLALSKQYDPALATMVSELKTEFNRVNNANPNPIAVLTGIMHRVKC